MNFGELLSACANGMIDVKCSVPIKGATSDVGQVVVLKDNRSWKGCAVQFPGLTYDTWFGEEPAATDRRSHYMHELFFI